MKKIVIYLKSGQLVEDTADEEDMDALLAGLGRSDLLEGLESVWVKGTDVSAIKWLD